jgi:hypothetical protein
MKIYSRVETPSTYSCCEVFLGTPSSFSKMVVFRRRAWPSCPGNCHSLAPRGPLISAVPGQARKSSHADQRQAIHNKKSKTATRTVHAKDQISLAGVGGGLTEWVTSSNMSSGAQTAVKVQKGRDRFPTRMATFSIYFP